LCFVLFGGAAGLRHGGARKNILAKVISEWFSAHLLNDRREDNVTAVAVFVFSAGLKGRRLVRKQREPIGFALRFEAVVTRRLERITQSCGVSEQVMKRYAGNFIGVGKIRK
jgi:hypothetical protein